MMLETASDFSLGPKRQSAALPHSMGPAHTEKMHPVDRRRCERDGLDFEEMRLGEEDIEPDTGGPVILEQPIKIVTPPLSMKDQDDRIRAVFALTRDDLLPEVDEDSLRTYYKCLAANMLTSSRKSLPVPPRTWRIWNAITLRILDAGRPKRSR